MKVSETDLKSREQTAAEIYELAKIYKNDLIQFKDYSLDEFYSYVHSIPFTPDPNDREIVSRPSYLLDRNQFPALDCKKKTTLFSAFFELKGWDYILIATATDQPEPHHIFALLWTGDDFHPVDATLSEDYLFKPKDGIINSDIMWNDV